MSSLAAVSRDYHSNVTYDIKRIAGRFNGYELCMRGFLGPGWTGRLTAALAQQGVSIVRGEAEKVSASAWDSRFELRSATSGCDPESLDYVSLADREIPYNRALAKIELTQFALEPCSRHDGSLYSEIRGIDRLGFLGDLLDYFSMRCLFPVRMSIETEGDKAVDRFWLRGVGGSKPSDSITEAIRMNLDKLLTSNA